MPRFVLLLPLALAVAACADADAPAEAESAPLTSASAVADSMLARFRANQLAADAFTVAAAGAEARYTISETDTAGLDPFRLVASPAGDALPAEEAQLLLEHVPNVARLAKGLRRADLVGVVNRDGREAYLLTTDDPSVLIGESTPKAPGSALTSRIYVDAGTFDVLEIYRTVADSTMAEPITDRLIYSDFREVDGLTLPFSVRRVTTGMNQAMNEEERTIYGGQIGFARRSAEQMPPGPEREARIKQVDAQARLLLDGVVDMELTVDSVRVDRSGPEAAE